MTFRLFDTSVGNLPPSFVSLMDDTLAANQARLFPGMTDEEVGVRMSPTYGRTKPGRNLTDVRLHYNPETGRCF